LPIVVGQAHSILIQS